MIVSCFNTLTPRGYWPLRGFLIYGEQFFLSFFKSITGYGLEKDKKDTGRNRKATKEFEQTCQ